MRVFLGLVVLISIFTIIGKMSGTSEWRLVGGVGDGSMIKFVVIAPGHEKNRAAYDSAVNRLCGQNASRNFCQIAFFQQGDKILSDDPPGTFARNDGFSRYPRLAVYLQNQKSQVADWTHWDCERAGVADSPLEVLCDPGVRKAYEASLSLGSHTSNIKGCGWPQTDDAAHFESYLLTVQDPARRVMYRSAFDTMNSGKVPDDPTNCIRFRSRSEDFAKVARQFLGLPQPTSELPMVPAARANGRRDGQ